ncbi:hypothetical protein SDC9_181382 [bioreactor metagenome]|uniref:Uncharacterized protein n=1 Tax=bioreactor metagenome TaxID=1076179 RepID=A0A645H5B3_9ZZZZ
MHVQLVLFNLLLANAECVAFFCAVLLAHRCVRVAGGADNRLERGNDCGLLHVHGNLRHLAVFLSARCFNDYAVVFVKLKFQRIEIIDASARFESYANHFHVFKLLTISACENARKSGVSLCVSLSVLRK